jgi:hypothetical protein
LYCSVAQAENKLLVVMRTDPKTKESLLTSSDFEQFQEIHRYVKTFTYLKEFDPSFWSKLIFELPRKHMN